MSAEDKEALKGMAQAMKELGPCAGTVKETMMTCFQQLEGGVREALGDGGSGLTPEKNNELGANVGVCYTEGLNKLSTCLAEQTQPEPVEDSTFEIVP